MSIKVLVVVLAGMLFVPAACAPASISPAAAASPSAVSVPAALACPAPPVLPETAPAVQGALPVEPAPLNLAQAALTPETKVGGSVRSLELEPNVVELGANVTVEVTVMNTGIGPIIYPLVVKIGDTIVKTQGVVLAGGESQNLTLMISAPIKDGVYHVSAGDIYRELDAWS